MSINIAAVAFLLFKILDIFGGFFNGAGGLFLDDLVECVVDVFGHAVSVATNIEEGAVFEPMEDVAGVFEEPVLDVDFVVLVAGEGSIEAMEGAVLQPGEELVFVEEVGGAVLLTEEEPIFAGCGGGLAFLEESSKGGDTSAGADHDDGGGGVVWETEVLGGVDEDGDGCGFCALGEEG